MASTKKNYRKLTRQGQYGYTLTMPTDEIRKLGWRERQKLRVRRVGKKLIIEDWTKS